MRAPAFWSEPLGLKAWSLAPFGWIYGSVTALRMGRTTKRAGVPVICVGNFTVGGAGKTPTVIMLAAALRASGETPFVVSRGYGGKIAGPVLVNPTEMTSGQCGDEPLMLARHVPVVVSRDRAIGADLARASGASVVLLDDGLQSPGLVKDFSIAVVDAGAGFGNGFCLPAGPLRAPLLAQMRHVDAVLSIGDAQDVSGVGPLLKGLGKPVFTARLEADAQGLRALSGQRLLAFAGIGRPEKFFATLKNAGLEVVRTRAFADHHPFTATDLAGLRREASAEGLTLVTTEKDAVRLPKGEPGIVSLPVTLVMLQDGLIELVQSALRRYRDQL